MSSVLLSGRIQSRFLELVLVDVCGARRTSFRALRELERSGCLHRNRIHDSHPKVADSESDIAELRLALAKGRQESVALHSNLRQVFHDLRIRNAIDLIRDLEFKKTLEELAFKCEGQQLEAGSSAGASVSESALLALYEDPAFLEKLKQFAQANDLEDEEVERVFRHIYTRICDLTAPRKPT